MYKNIDISYIGYITVKNSCYVKINSLNPLYLIINEVDGYVKEKNGNKYSFFDSANENNELLKKCNELWDGIKNEIETINGSKTSKNSSTEYDKDFMKIIFNSDYNLPLNTKLKPYNLIILIIVIISVFEEHGQFYPQVYLDECLYELV